MKNPKEEPKQETAVEWLFQQLWETPKDKLTWHSILEQAKEMEKQQIIEAIIKGHTESLFGRVCDSEKYYNETYKPE